MRLLDPVRELIQQGMHAAKPVLLEILAGEMKLGNPSIVEWHPDFH